MYGVNYVDTKKHTEYPDHIHKWNLIIGTNKHVPITSIKSIWLLIIDGDDFYSGNGFYLIPYINGSYCDTSDTES